MKTSISTLAFRKTAACPASATLLSFRAGSLTVEATGLVKEHLESCDFCCAELPLLAHHEKGSVAYQAPEIPINLRILAESLFKPKVKT